MQVLIACDDHSLGQRVLATLRKEGIDCPDGHLVQLDVAADRAGVMNPQLGIFVLAPDAASGLARLRETRNVVPHMHSLVLGPATDPKLILDTLKQGADEYLDLQTPEEELREALSRHRVELSTSQDSKTTGRVITVVAASGGSGSSTIAASVSTTLAQKYGECGLIDLRLGVGDLGPMFDLRPGRTLADLCDCTSRLDQQLFEQFLSRHGSGVRLLAAPTQVSDLDRITAKGIRRALALARVRFPFAVVDTGNALGEPHCEALWQADIVLLVLRLDYTSVRNTRRVIDKMAEIGIGRDRMRLVVNGFRQTGQLEVEQAEAAIGLKVMHQIPHDPKAVNSAVNNGVPVVLASRYSRVSRSLRALAVSVNGGTVPVPRVGPRLPLGNLLGGRHAADGRVDI
jgi:pilus assembly protein CpaE